MQLQNPLEFFKYSQENKVSNPRRKHI